ncbi:hypothetical protein BDN70DRAFT_988382 [Pholiota conissans]|uniref:F-box domain-containing protein n=1 Tax=Pholiota conissans TaxID=109636 RepID=A0A9P5ZHQ4_9AGAR|nr:hypothetical protein BDN70DRAFT_988382 [Pholiota conissans]
MASVQQLRQSDDKIPRWISKSKPLDYGSFDLWALFPAEIIPTPSIGSTSFKLGGNSSWPSELFPDIPCIKASSKRHLFSGEDNQSPSHRVVNTLPQPMQLDAFDQNVGRTNVQLNDQETWHVKARFHARRNRLLQIDAVLKNGHRRDLLQERARHVQLLNRYTVALAPHKRLPVEILQEIFQYISTGFACATPSLRNPPLVLCGVCSSWRRIVKSMPELWNTVYFSVDNTLMRLQKLAAAQLFFSSAGTLPLSLTLADAPEDKSPNVDFVRELIEPLSSRFRYLHIVLQPAQINALLSLPRGSLDGVSECHIVSDFSFSPEASQMPWDRPVTFFSPSARIRRLRLHLTPFIMPTVFMFPWHQLESFRSDSSIQAEDCRALLQECRSLQRVHLHIFGIKYSPPPTAEILLPNLTNLTVHLCDLENYDLFFLPLILPNLKALWIYNYDGLPWSPGMYNGLIYRSGCAIENLSIGTLDILEPNDVLALFQASPHLISVTLSHNTVVLPEILYRIGRGEIGRALIYLFLKGARALDPLLTMLEMRRGAPVPTVGPPGHDGYLPSALKFVETHCHPDEVRKYARRIHSLRDAGLEISLLDVVEGYFQL